MIDKLVIAKLGEIVHKPTQVRGALTFRRRDAMATNRARNASFSLERDPFGISSPGGVWHDPEKNNHAYMLAGSSAILFATAYADDSDKDKLGSYKFLKTITNGGYGIMF